MRNAPIRIRLLALAITAAAPISLFAQQGGAPKELPVKYSGPPTTAAITATDLMTRLYIYADDSMMGRQAGTEYNMKATSYIERELRRLGLQPAGDSGGFFQYLPVFARGLDTTSTVTIDGSTFKAGVDFTAGSGGRRPRQLSGAQVVWGGIRFDTANVLSPDAVRGKILLLRPFIPPPNFNSGPFVQSSGFKAFEALLAAAEAVAIVTWDQIPPAVLKNAINAQNVTFASEDESRISLNVTTKLAEAMLGVPLATATKGTVGKALTSNIRFVDAPRPTRNVVAILPGSDPRLKGEYVAIGAHNDHVGFRPSNPVDHDSLRAFMQVVLPQGADSRRRTPTADEAARVRAMTDSLHKLHPARLDSIFNGADDDGSGTVSVLEIAEAFAKGNPNPKPKRSVLFIWHVGEEMGLWGSQWFTDHPTVPRDAIVAELNMDMVGRGGANDITGESKDGGLLRGGPGYVQLVGSRRLSTELGDLIEKVNADTRLGFRFDYGMDANGHPQNIYCRSDHSEYARYGIPIVFFTTGGHADYHQVTDEPQYIDYDRMAQVAKLVYESALKVATLDKRPTVDKPKPDPKGTCVQ
jgi:hypothetical protein